MLQKVSIRESSTSVHQINNFFIDWNAVSIFLLLISAVEMYTSNKVKYLIRSLFVFKIHRFVDCIQLRVVLLTLAKKKKNFMQDDHLSRNFLTYFPKWLSIAG